ncbi:MAG: hypothetical protein KDA85_17130, partial [Planctomycetaceae bacterium]|nr:hypothetical protein [Planctomycetaceae bacterium]
MFHIVAAVAACLVVTGFTSLVNHKITMLGGAGLAVCLPLLCLFQQRSRIRPMFLILPIAMSVCCLISAHVNFAPSSSVIHILACYIAYAGFSAESPAFSRFCRLTILLTGFVMTMMVLVQTVRAGAISTWTVTGVGCGANLIAAELNMALPLVVYLAMQATGFRRFVISSCAAIMAFSVICVGSRNGIGAMLILGVFFGLFNHRKLAVVTTMLIGGVLVFLDEILQNSV